MVAESETRDVVGAFDAGWLCTGICGRRRNQRTVRSSSQILTRCHAGFGSGRRVATKVRSSAVEAALRDEALGALAAVVMGAVGTAGRLSG